MSISNQLFGRDAAVEIERVLRAVLAARSDVRFLIKYCRNALPPGTEASAEPGSRSRAVILVPSEQSTDDYLRTLRQCQIIVLPHAMTEYKAVTSGVFSEGAALGKIMVFPDNTWMADQVAEGRVIGVGFGGQERGRDHRRGGACHRRAPSAPAPGLGPSRRRFARRIPAAGTLDLMRTLAAQPEDMEPRFVLGTRYALDSTRCHLGDGWSGTEPTGVWTNSAVGELVLCCEPAPTGPLVLRLYLTPMLDAEGGNGSRSPSMAKPLVTGPSTAMRKSIRSGGI